MKDVEEQGNLIEWTVQIVGRRETHLLLCRNHITM